MAVAAIHTFSGIRPRIPESRLGNGEATIAENCDFAYGELRNTRNGFFIKSMANAAKSLYTENGVVFYSWADPGIYAVRSPMISDPHYRVYFTGDGDFMQVADRRLMVSAGGEPGAAVRVGVPAPANAPTLSVQQGTAVNGTTATITFRFHWEYGGVKYQDGTISPSIVGTDQYQFTPPAKAEGTPEQAIPVLRMKAVWLDSGLLAFDQYSGNSAFAKQNEAYSLDINDAGTGAYLCTLSHVVRESTKETRAYVYTYVNIYDEEGPPSPPAQVDTADGLEVAVTVAKDAVVNYAAIKEIRIYRTPPTAAAEYYLVGSVPVLSGSGPWTFDDDEVLLDTPLESREWYAPPQRLTGLTMLPNGILAGWVDEMVWFSEPYKPWAWPPRYAIPLEAPPVGAVAHGVGMIVTTVTVPYQISGVSSDSMTASRLNIAQAGVSPFSIAVVDGLVAYASNDGLVVLMGAVGSLVQGQRFFTRDVWMQRYGPYLDTMRFAVWDGRLVVYSDTGGFDAFMIRFDEADGTMTDLPDFAAQASFISPLADQFYYVVSGSLYQFNGGSNQSAVWQSREEVFPRPLNFAAAQALVEGSWSIEFWAYVEIAGGAHEYQLKHTQAVTTGRTVFRLPAGYMSDRYRVKITGTGRFRELRVAETMTELASL